MINKIYYIIKKSYKIIFIIGFIFMVLSKFSVVFGANYYMDDSNYSQDPSYIIKTTYDNNCYHAIKFLMNPNIHGTTYAQEVAYVIYNHYNYYVVPTGDVTFRFYFIYDDKPTSYINSHDDTGFDYISVPTVYGVMHYNSYYDFGYYNNMNPHYQISKTNVSAQTCYVPNILCNYGNESLYNWAKYELGYADTETIAGLLTVIATNTGDMSSKMDEMIEEQKETNDFMKSEDTSGVDTSYSNPGSGTSDSTESAFNGIFTRFYNAMTSNGYGTNITVPIPFTRKQITIPSNLTRNILAQYMGALFNDLIPLVWYFLVGLYILKDMAKIIQDIKSGDIMTKTDTNIKTDML